MERFCHLRTMYSKLCRGGNTCLLPQEFPAQWKGKRHTQKQLQCKPSMWTAIKKDR